MKLTNNLQTSFPTTLVEMKRVVSILDHALNLTMHEEF